MSRFDEAALSLLCVLAERVESSSCQIALANLEQLEINSSLAVNPKLCKEAWFKVLNTNNSVCIPVYFAGLFMRSLDTGQIDVLIEILERCSVPDKVRRCMLRFGIERINVEQAMRIALSDWFSEADRELAMAGFLERGGGDKSAISVLARSPGGYGRSSFYMACKIEGVIAAEEILQAYNALSLSGWYLLQIMDYRSDVFELVFDRFLNELGEELAMSCHLFDEVRRERLIRSAALCKSQLDRSRVLLYLAANPNTPFEVVVKIMDSLGCILKDGRFLKSYKVRGLGELVRVVNERFRFMYAPLGVKTNWRAITDTDERNAVDLILNQFVGRFPSNRRESWVLEGVSSEMGETGDYSAVYPDAASKAVVTVAKLRDKHYSEKYYILKSEAIDMIDVLGIAGWEIFCRSVPGWPGSVRELSETVLTLV